MLSTKEELSHDDVLAAIELLVDKNPMGIAKIDVARFLYPQLTETMMITGSNSGLYISVLNVIKLLEQEGKLIKSEFKGPRGAPLITMASPSLMKDLPLPVKKPNSNFKRLTAEKRVLRGKKIVRLHQAGVNNAEIGLQVGLSPLTVKEYLKTWERSGVAEYRGRKLLQVSSIQPPPPILSTQQLPPIKKTEKTKKTIKTLKISGADHTKWPRWLLWLVKSVAKRTRIKVTFILTPDLWDGGYLIQCRETPAMISQGRTIKEAVSNLLEVWNEHYDKLQKDRLV